MSECGVHGDDCPLDEEVTVLEAIYINEILVDRGPQGHVHELRLVLHPATADETDRQFVKITLVIKPSLNYPDDVPEINIENSRGLSDTQIKCLSEALNLHAESKRGWPMLHELIETAKDTLTAGNLPHCPCAICLDHFTSEQEIHKTVCYHYYHPDCLLEYVEYYRSTLEEPTSDKTIPCPICREDIEVDLPTVAATKKRADTEEVEYVPDAYVKALQEKMQQMYMKQKEKGGIIDLEAEKNKYLVQNGTVVLPREYVQDSEERFGQLVMESQARGEDRVAEEQKRPPELEKRKYQNHSRRGRNLHSAGNGKRESESRRSKPDTRPKQNDAHHDDGRRWGERHSSDSKRSARSEQRSDSGETSRSQPRTKSYNPRNRIERSERKGNTADTTDGCDANCDNQSSFKNDNAPRAANTNEAINRDNESEGRDERNRKVRRKPERREKVPDETSCFSQHPGFVPASDSNGDVQSGSRQSRDAPRDRDTSRDSENMAPPGFTGPPPGFNGVHRSARGRGRGRDRGISLEDRDKILKHTPYGRGWTVRGGASKRTRGRGADPDSVIIGQTS